MMLLWQKRAMVNVVNHRCSGVHSSGPYQADAATSGGGRLSGRGLIHEPRYSEVVGDLVQSAQQRRCYGNAKAGPPDPRFMAAFAGQPDAVHARACARWRASRAPPCRRCALNAATSPNACDVDRDDRLAGVGDAVVVVVEVDHLAAHRGAVRACRRAGRRSAPGHSPCSRLLPDRQQEAFVGALRVGQRLALAVDHPAHRHRSRRAAPWSSPCRRRRPSSPCPAPSAAPRRPAPRPRSDWSTAACPGRPRAAGGWRCRPRSTARSCRAPAACAA